MQRTRRIPVEPLSAAAFAPFGDVLHNDGSVQRNYYADSTRPGQGPGELRFWISHVVPQRAVPLAITQLERHPYSAQTFVPLKPSRWIVIVAPHAADGSPDTGGLRAFLAGPGQGICYRLGTWHHGTTVLEAPAQFGVLMWRRSAGDDDQFHDLAAPIEIDAAGHV